MHFSFSLLLLPYDEDDEGKSGVTTVVLSSQPGTYNRCTNEGGEDSKHPTFPLSLLFERNPFFLSFPSSNEGLGFFLSKPTLIKGRKGFFFFPPT